jgi:hypothetical protein
VAPLPSPALESLQPPLRQAVIRLHAWEQRRRWILVALLWLLVVPFCLWLLRARISLLLEYFTWSGLRYGLAFNQVAAMGLLATLLLTLTSVWSRWFYSHYGLAATEVRRLERLALRIQARGEGHPLWRRLWG